MEVIDLEQSQSPSPIDKKTDDATGIDNPDAKSFKSNDKHNDNNHDELDDDDDDVDCIEIIDNNQVNGFKNKSNNDLKSNDEINVNELKQKEKKSEAKVTVNGNCNEDDDQNDCDIMYISNDNKDNIVNDGKEHTLPVKSEKRKRIYVEETEITDEQCGFPLYLKEAVIRGKCIPINKKTWKDINIDGNDAILDCASQVVPLMIKKPDVFPCKLPPEENEETKIIEIDKETGKVIEEIDKDVGVEIDDENENNINSSNDENNHKLNRSLLTLKDFDKSSIGELLVGIGLSRAKEWVHHDMVKVYSRKKQKYGETDEIVNEINKNRNLLAHCKTANSVFNFELHKCHMCEFKTESSIVLEGHYFIPHLSNRKEYKCNYCLFITRDPRIIEEHFQVTHRKQCIIESPPQLYECPTCSYESSQKAKAMTHFTKCLKTFDPEKVCYTPDIESEYPTITPKPITQDDIIIYEDIVSHFRNIVNNNNLRTPFTFVSGLPRGLQYQIFLQQQQIAQQTRLSRLSRPMNGFGNQLQSISNNNNDTNASPQQLLQQHQQAMQHQMNQQLKYMESSNLQSLKNRMATNTNSNLIVQKGLNKLTIFGKGTPTNEGIANKSGTFVICEICDGYIKDLEQLRTHMQWIHKVKIHPKMLASRPPLNCQKCQWRFFTDQGLERHLLGAHGLVTSNMQDLVDQNLDGGRCTICGRVFANKLVSHMNQVHKITLRPAHLSYKCTVCSATFNLYRLFESHVYMVHNGSVKRNVTNESIMDKA